MFTTVANLFSAVTELLVVSCAVVDDPEQSRMAAVRMRSAENERSEQGQSSATTPGEGRTTAPRLRSSAQHSCHLTMAEIPLSKRGKWTDGVESGREY